MIEAKKLTQRERCSMYSTIVSLSPQPKRLGVLEGPKGALSCRTNDKGASGSLGGYGQTGCAGQTNGQLDRNSSHVLGYRPLGSRASGASSKKGQGIGSERENVPFSLSVCPSVRLSVSLSVRRYSLLTVGTSVSQSVRWSICLSVSPSICSSVCPTPASRDLLGAGRAEE